MDEHLLLFRKSIAKSSLVMKNEVEKIEKFIPKTGAIPKDVVLFVSNCFLVIWEAAKKKIPSKVAWEWAMRGESLLARVSSESASLYLVDLIIWTQRIPKSGLVGIVYFLFDNMHRKFPKGFVFYSL